MPSEETLIECECGRRYMRATIPSDQIESGSEQCACQRTLGEWSGLLRYTFEPETDGD
jgi:hypothetical protein